MRKLSSFRATAAIFIFSTWLAGAQAAENPPATQPAAAVPANTLYVVRWDILLKDSGLDTLGQLESQVVQSDSQLYQGAVYDAAALRGAIVQCKETDEMAASSESLTYAEDVNGHLFMPPEMSFNSAWVRRGPVRLNGNAQGTGDLSVVGADQVHLKLNYPQIHIDLWERNQRENQPSQPDASIVFDGTLKSGQALVMEASYAGASTETYHHLIAWEVFTAQALDQRYMSLISDSLGWCQNGPEGAVRLADQAIVWAAKSKTVWVQGSTEPSTKPSTGFEQKLEDGKTVRLIGFCRVDKWPDCWWNGKGQPLNPWGMDVSVSEFNLEHPLWVIVQVSGGKEEVARQTPRGQSGQDQSFASTILFPAEKDGQFILGVPVGDWQQVGEIKVGDSITVSGEIYRLQEVEPAGDGIFVEFYYRGNPTTVDSVTLTAVLKDGTEFNPDWVQQTIVKTYGNNAPHFVGIKPDQVKTFRVWLRKRQWVTFTNLPDAPAVLPTSDVTPAQVAAAQAQLTQRGFQTRPARYVPRRPTTQQSREWAAMSADPTTAMGAVRALINAAKKGDVQGVRARLSSPETDTDHGLDVYARFVTATISAQANAYARFGEQIVQEKSGVPLLIPDIETQTMLAPWQKLPDGSLHASGIAITRGKQGEFYFEFPATFLTAPHEREFFETKSQQAEAITDLLKQNPTMTFDEFCKAAIRAIAKPAATQPG